MKSGFLLILEVIFLYQVNGAVLLWSRNPIRISSMNLFGDDELFQLIEDLGGPDIFIFKTGTLKPELMDIFSGFQSAYNVNGFVSTDNATEITEDINDILKLKEVVQNANENILIVMVTPLKRTKREASLQQETTPIITEEPPQGPVLYKAKAKTGDYYGMLYSSRPLLLKTNDTMYFMQNAPSDMISVDTVGRDSFTRLNVNVPMKDGIKVTLRFYFTWFESYWSLQEVRFTDITNNLSFNLTLEQEFSTPAHFSYHCGGVTTFNDLINGAVLTIYDFQVQIDSLNGRFDDAYDCVPFTTVPIWSGLFVTAILGIGLVIALMAIENIKTMDKFDNYKTKQLPVTISE